MSEQNLEQQIQVRLVTDVHANWNEEERGEPGKFSLQLILDDGAEEYAIRPPAEDTNGYPEDASQRRIRSVRSNQQGTDTQQDLLRKSCVVRWSTQLLQGYTGQILRQLGCNNL